jgi:hypothetical protein
MRSGKSVAGHRDISVSELNAARIGEGIHHAVTTPGHPQPSRSSLAFRPRRRGREHLSRRAPEHAGFVAGVKASRSKGHGARRGVTVCGNVVLYVTKRGCVA